MSLLEDVFLEDEAGEAQELERIIEGDDNEDGQLPDSDENSEKEDEAEEDKRHVDPTSAKPKRVVKNPRVTLNPARLTGPRGIQVIPEHFKDFKFKGKGHEKEDLDIVLKKLEHWAYRLYPKFEFKDCLKKIETLGNKRPVMVHLTKIRTDQFVSEDTVVQRDSSDEETPQVPQPQEDEFDRLLQQQIELARATPGPGSVRKVPATPVQDRSHIMPKATSSPSINDEQRKRMLRNRQLAEERRLARLKNNQSQNATSSLENSISDIPTEDPKNNVSKDENSAEKTTIVSENPDNNRITIEDDQENIAKAKSNRSNVIDSSDDDDGLVINESVNIDVDYTRNDDDSNLDDINDNKQDNFEQINNIKSFDNTEQRSDIFNRNEKCLKESDEQKQNKNYKLLISATKYTNETSLQDIEEIRTESQDIKMDSNKANKSIPNSSKLYDNEININKPDINSIDEDIVKVNSDKIDLINLQTNRSCKIVSEQNNENDHRKETSDIVMVETEKAIQNAEHMDVDF